MKIFTQLGTYKWVQMALISCNSVKNNGQESTFKEIDQFKNA